MNFNQFGWTESGSQTFNSGFQVSYNDANGPGVYFHVVVENQNTSEITYINSVSNLYFLDTVSSSGSSAKFVPILSMIVNGTTFQSPSGYIALKPNVPVNLTFGYSLLFLTSASPTGSGPFTVQKVGSTSTPAQYTLTLDFLMLFGYIQPIGSSTTISYGQTLPFTSIFWE
jgi:hypothetical protein